MKFWIAVTVAAFYRSMINDILHIEVSSFLVTKNISNKLMSKIRQRTQPKFEQVWKVISSVHLPMAWDHPTSVRPSDFSVNLNVNLLHRRVRHMFKLINFLHMVLWGRHTTLSSVSQLGPASSPSLWVATKYGLLKSGATCDEFGFRKMSSLDHHFKRYA